MTMTAPEGAHDEVALFDGLFRRCPFLFALLVDSDGRVAAHSAQADSLTIEDGRPLSAYLAEGQEAWLHQARGRAETGQLLPLVLASPAGEKKALDLFCAPLDGGFVLYGILPQGDDGNVISSLSALNLEMANITRELQKKNRELAEANRTITRLMNTDTLTAISNRRHFHELAARSLSFAVRHGVPLSLIMADIDHFKGVKDRYGHDTGDAVLVAFAAMLSSLTRLEDVVARYGGEEFLVLLDETSIDQALVTAERLRQETMKLRVAAVDEAIRASFGVVQLRPGEDLQNLIRRADEALYRAKSGGRNRVEGER